MARLIWNHPQQGTRDFLLHPVTVLGRESGVDCVLNVRSVSRRHARIEQTADGYFIHDLGSTNGTWVNDTPVSKTEPTLIRRGDRIKIGEESLEFDPEVESSPRTQESMVTAPLDRTRDPAASRDFPQRIGKFHLVRRLGQGGMGVVFQALDLDSNRNVAVKFIRSNIGKREAFLDFFHNREAVLAPRDRPPERHPRL